MTTLHNNYQVAGHFKLQRIKADTGEVVQTLEFKNLITDLGLNYVGSNVPIYYAYVSTNSTPPSVSDTSLSGFRAYTGTVQSDTKNSLSTSPYWIEQTQVYRFSAGAASGNLTKVGVGWTSNSVSGLWSSALIVDGSGNPTTLTVLADEFLDVSYTLRYYPPLADSTAVVSISGVNYTVTTRAALITNRDIRMTTSMSIGGYSTVYSGPVTLGPVTGTITGSTSYTSGASLNSSAYVDGSLRHVGTMTLGLSSGNVPGGITGMLISAPSGSFLGCPVQMTFSPAIPKDATKTLSLNLSISWSRYP